MVEMKRKSTCQYLSRSFVQERSWPFSRLQTMVTWFVKVEAAKMTDVIGGLCREKGQVLETDRTGRMRTGVCQVVPGVGNWGMVDPRYARYGAPQLHLPVP